MDKILMYTLREEDLAVTAGGVVNLILRNCVHVTRSGRRTLPSPPEAWSISFSETACM